MRARKGLLQRGALAVLLGISALVAGASSASAVVVCDRWGRCWHAHHHYYYPGYYYGAYGYPYSDPYWYGPGYAYGPPPYYYGYGPYYYGPGVSFGFTVGGHHHWH